MIKYIAILVLTCACSWSMAQVNIITTIAGTGIAGYSGDGGLAVSTQFDRPYGLYLYAGTQLYVVDAFNHRLRKIALTTGLVSTIAGKGTSGFSGDGGPASLCELFVPQGVYIASSNNIYLSDGLNQRIRKISASGTIETIAGNGVAGFGGDGGPATDAQLNEPAGLFVDNENNVYFGDHTNHRLRKIDQTNNTIVTIAGNGISGFSGDGGPATNASMNGVIDVVGDNRGHLYISDTWNGAIRKLDIATGRISTVVGTGTPGYSGDGGQATSAQLSEPTGIFLDSHNNLFISDYRNGAIRKVDAVSGIITTVAGGVAGYGGDGGPATAAKLKCTDIVVDDYGNIYIADYVNHRIRKVSSGVAVNGINKDAESRLYPNPTTGIFNIHTPAPISLVSIYNIGGVLVHEQTCIAAETQVDISAQPPGAYVVYVRCGEKMYVSKVLKN